MPKLNTEFRIEWQAWGWRYYFNGQWSHNFYDSEAKAMRAVKSLIAPILPYMCNNCKDVSNVKLVLYHVFLGDSTKSVSWRLCDTCEPLFPHKRIKHG